MRRGRVARERCRTPKGRNIQLVGCPHDGPVEDQIRAAGEAVGQVDHVEAALDSTLERNRAELEQLLEQHDPQNFDATIMPLEEMHDRLHRVLAQGSFVLCVSEGRFDGAHTAFYDLFRLADGMIVEHWDTTETVAPKADWKNNNGKF